jgi:hypothetical protein
MRLRQRQKVQVLLQATIMNSELQAQTDAVLDALQDGFRALHFDLLCTNVLLLAILCVVFFRSYKRQP